MTLVLLWLFAGHVNKSQYLVDCFDLIEVNHVYDDAGCRSFVQLIYWDWDSSRNQFACQGYMTMRECLVKTEAGQKKFDAALDKICKGQPLQFQVEFRRAMTYRGDFVKKGRYPVRDFRRKIWKSTWQDKGVYRQIQASQFRETYTSFDVEVKDREVHPLSCRRGLQKIPSFDATVVR